VQFERTNHDAGAGGALAAASRQLSRQLSRAAGVAHAAFRMTALQWKPQQSRPTEWENVTDFETDMDAWHRHSAPFFAPRRLRALTRADVAHLNIGSGLLQQQARHLCVTIGMPHFSLHCITPQVACRLMMIATPHR
jgi:hypothetical protein